MTKTDDTQRRGRGRLWRFWGVLGLLPTIVPQSGCFTAHYLGQQAVGQLSLLRARRHVSEVLADPATSPKVRERLTLAMAARQFGIEYLGLRGGAEFTRYVDTGGPVAYNLTVAHKDALRIVRWKFPLVGTVPYLGFFKRADAEVEIKKLKEQGFDVYLRPVGAYSTLGYLLSPIYASMIQGEGEAGEVHAVETLLHEMAHSTAYLRSASELNESFASLVGVKGAALFFKLRGEAAMSARVEQLAAEEEKQAQAFSAWFQPALAELRAFYESAQKAGLPKAEILVQREAAFEKLRQSYRAAFPTGPRYHRLAEGPINNALVLSFGVYHSNAAFQEALLDSVDGDISAYVQLYKQAEGRSDAREFLERRAAAHKATLPLDR